MQTGDCLPDEVRRADNRHREPEGPGPPPGGTLGLWTSQAKQGQGWREVDQHCLVVRKIITYIVFCFLTGDEFFYYELSFWNFHHFLRMSQWCNFLHI